MAFFKQLDRSVPRSLAIQVVLDNLSAHKAEAVREWLANQRSTRVNQELERRVSAVVGDRGSSRSPISYPVPPPQGASMMPSTPAILRLNGYADTGTPL